MSDPTNPGAPPRVEDEFSRLLDTLQSNVGRYVAFLLTPILLPLVGAVAFWLQDALGVDMDPVAVTGFLVAVIGGLAAVLVTWLRNRGKFESAAAETLTLLKAAQDTVAAAPAPSEGPPTAVATTGDVVIQRVGDGEEYADVGAASLEEYGEPVSPDRSFGDAGT
jgi:uncharacterized membrane protein YeaQ/YmgE (transglycosylase-associated protein family)